MEGGANGEGQICEQINIGGCILLGVVAIAALPAELVAGGVALLVVGRTATAAPTKKD